VHWANLKIGGDLQGGADFLIAQTGGDFTVPIRKAVWRGCNKKAKCYLNSKKLNI
jgi:hypothetical protein